MKTTNKFSVVIYNGEVRQESVFETLHDAIVELACAIENDEAGDAQRLEMDECILWNSKDEVMFDEWVDLFTKVCPKCGHRLFKADFHKSTKSTTGYQSYCKKCAAEANKQRAKSRNAIDSVETTLHDGHTLSKIHKHAGLASFTPRQLMEELKARGYSWNYMLEPQRKVMFEKI